MKESERLTVYIGDTLMGMDLSAEHLLVGRKTCAEVNLMQHFA